MSAFFVVSNVLLKFFNKVIFYFVSVLFDLVIKVCLRLRSKSSIILFNMVFNSFFSTIAKVNDGDLKTIISLSGIFTSKSFLSSVDSCGKYNGLPGQSKSLKLSSVFIWLKEYKGSFGIFSIASPGNFNELTFFLASSNILSRLTLRVLDNVKLYLNRSFEN